MSAVLQINALGIARFRALAGALHFTAKSEAGRWLVKKANAIDVRHNEANFDSEGAATGPMWAENNPRWAKFKKETTGADQPLVFKGRLRASLTDPGHRDRIAKIAKSIVSLGTRVKYAGKHRTAHEAPRFTARAGGRSFDSRGRWGVPGRDFLRRSSAMTGELLGDIAREIKRRAAKAWLSADGGSDAALRAIGGGGIARLIVLSKSDVAKFLRARTASGYTRGGLR